jgi:hypothetical protein
MQELLSSQELLDFLQPIPDLCLDSCVLDLQSNSDSGSINYCSDESLSPSPEISEIPLSLSPLREEGPKNKKISKPISKKKKTQKEERKTHFTLDRDLLLTMSLEEFESRIQSLSKGKAISKEESNDIKRQRRLIKNRQSAMASRERKKEEMTVLKQENDALKKEISYLRSFIDFLTVGKPLENQENSPSIPVLMIFGLLFSFIILLPSSISLFGAQNGSSHLNTTLPLTNTQPQVVDTVSPQIKTKILNYNQHLMSTTSKESSPLRRELLLMNDFNDTSIFEEEMETQQEVFEMLSVHSSESFDRNPTINDENSYSPVISL